MTEHPRDLESAGHDRRPPYRRPHPHGGPSARPTVDYRSGPPSSVRESYHHLPHDAHFFNRPSSNRRRPIHDARARPHDHQPESGPRLHHREPVDDAYAECSDCTPPFDADKPRSRRSSDDRCSYHRGMGDNDYRSARRHADPRDRPRNASDTSAPVQAAAPIRDSCPESEAPWSRWDGPRPDPRSASQTRTRESLTDYRGALARTHSPVIDLTAPTTTPRHASFRATSPFVDSTAAETTGCAHQSEAAPAPSDQTSVKPQVTRSEHPGPPPARPFAVTEPTQSSLDSQSSDVLLKGTSSLALRTPPVAGGDQNDAAIALPLEDSGSCEATGKPSDASPCDPRRRPSSLTDDMDCSMSIYSDMPTGSPPQSSPARDQATPMERAQIESSPDVPPDPRHQRTESAEFKRKADSKPKHISTNILSEDDEEDQLIWSEDEPTSDGCESLFRSSDDEVEQSQRTNDSDDDLPLGLVMLGRQKSADPESHFFTRSVVHPPAGTRDSSSADAAVEPEPHPGPTPVSSRPQRACKALSKASGIPLLRTASSRGTTGEVLRLSREEMAKLPDMSNSREVQRAYREVQTNEFPPQGGGKRFVSVRSRARSDAEPSECDCEFDRADPKSACGTDHCINRATVMECDKHCRMGKKCLNKRLQRREWKRCSVVDVGAKGYGLRADQRMEDKDLIIEYLGEVIGSAELERRKHQYTQDGLRHFYFMSLGRNQFVDATHVGSRARFLNHSCNPNCRVVKWNVGAEVRLGVYAWRTIEAGEELTFNYQTEVYGEDTRCLCGESNCCGILGGANAVAVLGALGISSKFTGQSAPETEAALADAQRAAEEAEARAKNEAQILAETQRAAEEAEAKAKEEASVIAQVQERARKRLVAEARREKKRVANEQKRVQLQEEKERQLQKAQEEKERHEQAARRAELAAIAAREAAQATKSAREAERAATSAKVVAQAAKARGQQSRSVQMSPGSAPQALSEEDVPKMIVAMRQAIDNDEVLLLLLERLNLWNCPTMQRSFIRLHGLTVLAQILLVWMDNSLIVERLLTVLGGLPLSSRNRIDDAGLLGLLYKVSQQYAQQRDVRTLASSLKRSWERLPVTYHIGRNQQGEPADPSATHNEVRSGEADGEQQPADRSWGYLGHRLFEGQESSSLQMLPPAASETQDFHVPPSARTGRWRGLRESQLRDEAPPPDPRREAMEQAAMQLRRREALASQWISSSSAMAAPDVNSIINRARRRNQGAQLPGQLGALMGRPTVFWEGGSVVGPAGPLANSAHHQPPMMPIHLDEGQPYGQGIWALDHHRRPVALHGDSPQHHLVHPEGDSPQLLGASTPQLLHAQEDSPLSVGSADTPPNPHTGDAPRQPAAKAPSPVGFQPKRCKPPSSYPRVSEHEQLVLARAWMRDLIAEYVVHRFQIELGSSRPLKDDSSTFNEEEFRTHAKAFTAYFTRAHIRNCEPYWPPEKLPPALDNKTRLMIKRKVALHTRETILPSFRAGRLALPIVEQEGETVLSPIHLGAPFRKRAANELSEGPPDVSAEPSKRRRLSDENANHDGPQVSLHGRFPTERKPSGDAFDSRRAKTVHSLQTSVRPSAEQSDTIPLVDGTSASSEALAGLTIHSGPRVPMPPSPPQIAPSKWPSLPLVSKPPNTSSKPLACSTPDSHPAPAHLLPPKKAVGSASHVRGCASLYSSAPDFGPSQPSSHTTNSRESLPVDKAIMPSVLATALKAANGAGDLRRYGGRSL